MVVRRPSKALFLSPLIKVAIISTAANLYTKSIHYLEKGKPTDLGLALEIVVESEGNVYFSIYIYIPFVHISGYIRVYISLSLFLYI